MKLDRGSSNSGKYEPSEFWLLILRCG